MMCLGFSAIRSRRTGSVCLLALLFGVAVALAQIGPFPGSPIPGAPYPNGRYPAGRYPGGSRTPGSGLPLPGGKKGKQAEPQQLIDITGVLRMLDDKQIVVETDDHRVLNLKRADTTKFLKNGDPMKPADLKPGDHLQIDASQDSKSIFYAVTVNFQKEGTASEKTAASKPVDLPGQDSSPVDSDDDRPRLKRADSPVKVETPENTEQSAQVKTDPAPTPPNEAVEEAPPRRIAADQPLPAAEADPDDPGPPTLRRGIPTKRAPSAPPRQIASAKPPASATPAAPVRTPSPAPPPEPATVARVAPPPQPESAAREARSEDPVIEKAREAAEAFSETLPNYVCQQFTARFYSDTHVPSWKPQDVVSANVVYENGRESYRDIKINGKATKKGEEEQSGAWSTGEFGTLLRDLFSPSTAAEFHFRRDSTIAGMAAAVYDYQVQRENSHWRVQVPSQYVYPAYKGSVWIDKKNGRVLRVEMQTRSLPKEFPLDTVETAADYEYVRIGGTQQFLLPVHSETLMCQRESNVCNKNTIDFRNYRKYSGEATITFDK